MSIVVSRNVPRTMAVLGALIAMTVPPAWNATADVPTCFGEPVTMMGTDGPDNLVGLGDVRDVIYGGDGDDYILGGEFYEGGDAQDLLCGGKGRDIVLGSPGDDRLTGGGGRDEVDGANGADLELGGPGGDRVGQGSFDDADAADDVVKGGPGKDRLVSGWGNDELYGQDGNDTLTDLECDRTHMDGGAGDDSFESWSSSFDGWHGNVCSSHADRILGRAGADTAEVDELDRVTGVEQVTRIDEPTG